MKLTVLGGFGTAGTAVTAAARAAGHEVEAVSRRTGADVLSGEGLDAAFSDTEVVIGAFNHFTMSTAKAVRAQQTAAKNVLAAAERQDVAHVVLLSIVGVDRNPTNYYAGKLAQEKVYEASDVPHAIQRVTQFHEFAPQMLKRTGAGPLSQMVKAYAQSTGRRGPVIPAHMPVPMFRGSAQRSEPSARRGGPGHADLRPVVGAAEQTEPALTHRSATASGGSRCPWDFIRWCLRQSA